MVAKKTLSLPAEKQWPLQQKNKKVMGFRMWKPDFLSIIFTAHL